MIRTYKGIVMPSYMVIFTVKGVNCKIYLTCSKFQSMFPETFLLKLLLEMSKLQIFKGSGPVFNKLLKYDLVKKSKYFCLSHC